MENCVPRFCIVTFTGSPGNELNSDGSLEEIPVQDGYVRKGGSGVCRESSGPWFSCNACTENLFHSLDTEAHDK